MSERIEIGDFVDVHFTTSVSLLNMEVLSIPSDTGDSWRLKGRLGERDLHYVQFFERMDKRKEPAK